MTAPAPTRRAHIRVVNPDAEPPAEWIHAVAVMLLAHVDRQMAAERDQAHQADEEDEETTET